MKNPKISIIIPIYKVEKYLARCLDSVLTQTFTDFEVVCVNDGSPDGCGKILEQYAKKDKRIKIITQSNQGLSMARNNGLAVAIGEYIYFLDSDDCIHPQLLEVAYGLSVKHDADLFSFAFESVNPDFIISDKNRFNINKIKHKLTQNPLDFCKKRCRYKIAVNVWSKLYKSSFIKDFPFIADIYFEDYPYTIALMAKRPKTVLIEEKLYYYTDNQTSISKTQITPKHIKDYHTGLNFIYEQFKLSSKNEKNFVIKEVFSNILKQQLNKIMRSPIDKQPALLKTFAEELRDLNDKKCIRLSGTKLSRYFTYKKLIKKG